MIVWLSGPTGAGKTSLARSLRTNGYAIVEESVPGNLFRAFASEPIANCELLQRHLMQARLDGWRKVMGAPRIAFDRSIDEDIEVFCRLHKRTGVLTQRQFNSLAQFGRTLQVEIPNPDLIVFVNSVPEVLLRRLQNSETPAPIIKSLGLQISLYSRWLRGRREEVLQLDTTRSSERAMTRFFWENSKC
jgi:deoxyadenosine/deoxycytidine kinase